MDNLSKSGTGFINFYFANGHHEGFFRARDNPECGWEVFDGVWNNIHFKGGELASLFKSSVTKILYSDFCINDTEILYSAYDYFSFKKLLHRLAPVNISTLRVMIPCKSEGGYAS